MLRANVIFVQLFDGEKQSRLNSSIEFACGNSQLRFLKIRAIGFSLIYPQSCPKKIAAHSLKAQTAGI